MFEGCPYGFRSNGCIIKSGFGIVGTVLNHLSFSGLITDPTTSEVNDSDKALNL
ncbi:phage holin [Bacillus atrophaeus]|uniref:phage holin n=1 Tax=Bacillus atrophaeus TaxID=1452 RepID=UPI00399D0A65